MNYRKLGRSDLEVSEISFGCWTMGGLNWVNGQPNGWADPSEDEVAAGVKVALDAGVNHFDNADAYGNGKAERMLARCLEKLGVKTDKVIVATKVGHFPGTAEHAYEPAHIRHQCEQSLINLKRDCVDLYYFHHGNFGPEDRYLAGAVDMMNRLVQEGKVRWVGLSAYSADDFERLVPAVKPVCLQGPANALHGCVNIHGCPERKYPLAVNLPPEGDLPPVELPQPLNIHAKELRIQGIHSQLNEVRIDGFDIAVRVEEHEFPGPLDDLAVLSVHRFEQFAPGGGTDEKRGVRPPIVHQRNRINVSPRPGEHILPIVVMHHSDERPDLLRAVRKIHIQVFRTTEKLEPFKRTGAGRRDHKERTGITVPVDIIPIAGAQEFPWRPERA